MADSTIAITAGSGTAIDTRTEATNGNHRQVVVIGDPATNAGVAPVDATAGLKVDLGADNDVTIASGTVTAVTAITNALPAGTNAIGKLAANSGVDIGDVDVASIAAGDNNIGNVDIASIAAGNNNIGDVDVASIIPGTGATNLGKAIDTATGAIDTGVLALATRDDALSTLTPAESDNVQLRTNSTGALWVIPSGTVTVDGSGVTQPVSGTVTANLSATDNAVLDTIDAVLDTINAKLVTGTDIGDVTINNSTGAAAVNIQDGGNTITVDGTVAVTNADITSIKTAVETIDNAISGSEMQVDVVGALPAGTNVVGKVDHSITGIGHGVTTVTTAGTDVALAASTACKKVTIQAQTDNTSLIAVGATGVDATIATGTGVVLYPGDVFELEIDNLADICIDSLVNGEGVRYTYFT